MPNHSYALIAHTPIRATAHSCTRLLAHVQVCAHACTSIPAHTQWRTCPFPLDLTDMRTHSLAGLFACVHTSQRQSFTCAPIATALICKCAHRVQTCSHVACARKPIQTHANFLARLLLLRSHVPRACKPIHIYAHSCAIVLFTQASNCACLYLCEKCQSCEHLFDTHLVHVSHRRFHD